MFGTRGAAVRADAAPEERARNTDERFHKNLADSLISPRCRGPMSLREKVPKVARGTVLTQTAAPEVPPRLPSAPSKER